MVAGQNRNCVLLGTLTCIDRRGFWDLVIILKVYQITNQINFNFWKSSFVFFFVLTQYTSIGSDSVVSRKLVLGSLKDI